MAQAGGQFVSGLLFDARVRQGSFTLAATVRAAPGEIVAILGPNGAGKSTLLRTVAGLHPAESGRIELDGVPLDDPSTRQYLPAAQRRIGVVFQDHRLFPHLSAVDNVAFGLRAQGMPRAAARSAARQWLVRVGLAEHAQDRPGRLSGGQAQRVALARALACEPRLLLLDEPLASLDVQTRAEVQGELRTHLATFAGPTLFVTHDPIEALLLARRIVVLEGGTVVQDGTAAQITGRPVTPYVARLVGMNLYRGHAVRGTVELDGGGVLVVPDARDGRVLVSVRPSAFTVHTEQPHASSARNVLPGIVRAMAPLADRIRLTVAGTVETLVDVTAPAVAELGLVPGHQVWLAAKATDLESYPEPAGDRP
ncbi:MAG TPA: ABC transporter ATP-binding protein [Jatrophihabitantaceae bacterium]|nr:ABC transporter ATP-binding protein [Jatrophihabitantaceae bacterium]